MATKSTSRQTEHRDRGPRRLRDQPVLFLGLFLAPFAGLLTAWAIHLYVNGWTVGTWHVAGSPTVQGLVNLFIGAFGVVLMYSAWHFAEHRRPPLRYALVASVGTLAILFGGNVGSGPHRWWAFWFVIGAWSVAALWSLTRLNVTRQDPREPNEDGDGPEWTRRLKGWRTRKQPVTTYDDHGNPLRTEIPLRNDEGGTVREVQDAVPNIESYSGAPSGLSRAVGGDRADQATVTLLHTDPLKGLLPYGPPSHPGGSIADPILCGTYDDGHPVWCHLAGGAGFSPTAYLFMGMTRTGKTTTENQMLTEIITRRDVVILYLNKAKGEQDVRPIIPGVEVAVLSDDIGAYVAAMSRVQAIMSYRKRVLAEYGIPAWSARRCFHNPPQRKANGDPVPMAPMPALICHFGEADAILQESSAGAEMAVYITSKALSLGGIPGWSQQRAHSDQMPTGLRYNIGTAFCFGTGDAVSAGFALTDDTIAAGAHPENWKQSMPGNFYLENVGIDRALWPKRAKSAMLAPGCSPDAPQDVIDAAMADAMLERCRRFAPHMAKLDRGSAEATGAPGEPGNWWDLAAAATDRIRNSLIGGPQPMSANGSAPKPATSATAPANRSATFTVTAPQPQDEDAALAAEVSANIAATRTIDGFDLYPQYADGISPGDIDLSDPITPPQPGEDISWADPRPEPLDRAMAEEAFVRVLREVIELADLRDPADPTGNTVIVNPTELNKRYPYRVRSWYSEILRDMCNGKVTPPPAMALSRAEDLGPGKYRLSRVPVEDHS